MNENTTLMFSQWKIDARNELLKLRGALRFCFLQKELKLTTRVKPVTSLIIARHIGRGTQKASLF